MTGGPAPGSLLDAPGWVLADEHLEHRANLSSLEIEQLQSERLAWSVAQAARSELYTEKLADAGVRADAIHDIRDLHMLPFTDGEEIRTEVERGKSSRRSLAVDARAVCMVHASSGSTGAPKVFPYTSNDFRRWSANVALLLWIAGVRKSDICVAPVPMGQFTGGAGCYLGFSALGATFVPIDVGPGTAERVVAHLTGAVSFGDRRIEIDPLLQANSLLALPSFLPRLIAMLEELRLLDQLLLTKAQYGAEPSSEALIDKVEAAFGFRPKELYGLGEFWGPCVAAEADEPGRLRVLSDDYIAEILDPMSGEEVAPGDVGELVLTSLTKEAMPLLRYRTGDRVVAVEQRASGCGHLEIGRIPGRIDADDIMLAGALLVSRTLLEDLILRVPGAGTEYMISTSRATGEIAKMQVAIEGPAHVADAISEEISSRVRREYKQGAIVHVVPVGTIPRTPGKARRLCSEEELLGLVRRADSE